MAKINVTVLDAHDGYITKVKHGGETYELTHKPAQVGDIYRCNYANGLHFTEGAFYRQGDRDIIDNDGHDICIGHSKFDVFAKVEPAGTPRLQVGQLAKVIHSDFGNEGVVVKITGEGKFFDYALNRLDNGDDYREADADRLTPYTPKDGDDITVAGDTYTLRDRKAQVGDKVLVIDSGSSKLSVGDVITVEREDGGDIATSELSTWISHESGEYLVLERKSALVPVDNDEADEIKRNIPLDVLHKAATIFAKQGDGYEVVKSRHGDVTEGGHYTEGFVKVYAENHTDVYIAKGAGHYRS